MVLLRHAMMFLAKKMQTYLGSTVFQLNMNGEKKEQNGGRKADKEKREQEQYQEKKQYEFILKPNKLWKDSK